MSNRGFLAGVALLAIAGSVASAGTVKLGDPSWGRSGSGGEFRVHSTTGFVGLNNLPADAAYTGAQAGNWGTFCIEIGEYLNGFPSATFNTTIDKWAIKGNVVTNPGNPNQPAGPGTDALEYETAFLYHAFRYGKLDDYQAAAAAGAYGVSLDTLADAAGTFDYAAGAARSADTAQLQGALWKFEEGNTNGVIGAMKDFLVALAAYHVAAGGDWFGKGIGSVRVLNLFDNAGGNIQSQLTIIPLPTAGGMAMAGLLGVLAIRRRVRL